MTQVFYSRVLTPMAQAFLWVVPTMLFVGVVYEIATTVRLRKAAGSRPATEAQRRRDVRLLLVGAVLGAAASRVPVSTFASARLGMLLVLPTFGAAVGLVASGLLPAVEATDSRVADLANRTVRSYVSPRAVRTLWASTAVTLLLAVIRLILPPERPLPDRVVELLGARPVLAPTRALYVVVAVSAVVFAATTWAAASAVVRRGRPASDADALARQDQARQDATRRLLAWSSATLLLLDATLLTPFPQKMGGIVFGDVQLVQRATDVLTITFVVAAAVVVVRGHLRPNGTAIAVAP